MTSSKVSRVYQYPQAVASMGAPETVADFFAPDVVFQGISKADRAAGQSQPLR